MKTLILRICRWLLLVLALSLLPLAQLVGAATAQAETGSDVSSVCTLGVDGALSGCAPIKLPSPGLINPHYLGSDETRAAMHRLEDRAVDLTLAEHGLPAGDREAVKSWGRSDAQATLWALIVEAIETPAGQRTADQQAAVTWIASMDMSLKAWAGRNAGLEYVKWAGLNVQHYWDLLDSDPSVAELTDYLHSGLEPYDAAGRAKATGGYCRYQPPAPYQDEYSGSTAQTCFTPCPNALGCYVPTPTFDQFARWGASTASAASAGTMGYLTTSLGISSAATFGTAMGAAGLTTLALVIADATGLFAATPFSSAVLNLAVPALEAETGMIADWTAPLVSEELGATFETAVDVGLFEGSELLAGLEGTMVSGVIVIITWAVVTAVLEGIRVFDNDSLPGKVAQLVVDSAKTMPDPATSIDSTQGAASLFNAFVFATQPAPVNDGACRTRPGLWEYRLGLVKDLDEGSEGSFLYYSEDEGRLVERDGYECLNPTPLPQPRDTDPQFLVEPRDRQAGDPALPTRTGSITLASKDVGLSSTVRLSDTWFVKHIVVGGQTADVQSLSTTYTDWDGVSQHVWLVRKPDGDYVFAGRPLQVGSTGDSGWSSKYLEYVGPDGRDYRASVEGYRAPVGSPTYVPRTPVEGSPVSFAASVFAPGGPLVYPVQHSWRFQDDSCGGPCQGPRGTLQDMALRPTYGAPVTGRGPQHTWQAPGTYSVELTATDASGKSAVTTFEVRVGAVAPTLELADGDQTAEVGSSTVLSGRLTHTGVNDGERVTVDWGDGTPAESVEAGPGAALHLEGNPVELQEVSPTVMDWQAHHTYTAPGSRLVTVWVSDGAGLTATRTYRQDVHGPQTITFSPPTHARYGDQLTLRAIGGGSSQPVTYAAAPASVCTLDGTHLQLTGVGPCTVTAHQEGDEGLYETATPVERVVQADPAPLTVRARETDRVYGSQRQSPYQTDVGGLRNADAVADLDGLVVTGPPRDADVGQYPLVASGITNPHYDVTYLPGRETITPAPLTVTPTDQTRTYGAPPPAYTATFDGLVNNDRPAEITGLQFTGAPPDAHTGTYRTNARNATNHNYQYRYLPGVETITPAPLTIRATNRTTRFGQVASDSWTVEGFVNGDRTLHVVPACTATVDGAPASASTRPGSHAGAITCRGAADPDYAISYAAGTLIVNPLLTVEKVAGLPDPTSSRATLDGQDVSLPLTSREVGYGTRHEVSFTPAVLDPDGVLHVTVDWFRGSVSDNLSVTATYRTLSELLAGRPDVSDGEAAALDTRWTAVQRELVDGDSPGARTQLKLFIRTVQDWDTDNRLGTKSALQIVAYAQAVLTWIADAGVTGPPGHSSAGS